jgi:hypothetical protein
MMAGVFRVRVGARPKTKGRRYPTLFPLMNGENVKPIET